MEQKNSPSNTNNKSNSIIYYSLTFLIALLFELYWIFTRPYDYFMVIGIGIIVIITGYLTIDGITKAKAAEAALRQEQNEMIIKAQKAIYLATKKNVTESEKNREQNMRAIEVLVKSMVTSQKELVNVITTKSDELADKQLESHDNTSDMSALVDKLTESNDKLAKQVQSALTINELVKSNAELVKNVQAIMESSAQLAGSSNENLNAIPDESLNTIPNENLNTIPDENLNTIPVDNISELVNNDSILEEAKTLDNIPDVDISEIDEILEDNEVTEAAADDTVDNNIAEADESTSADINNDINMAQMAEAQTLEDMTVAEEISPELDAEMSNNIQEDANRPLTEEEIAALFASL